MRGPCRTGLGEGRSAVAQRRVGRSRLVHAGVLRDERVRRERSHPRPARRSGHAGHPELRRDVDAGCRRGEDRAGRLRTMAKRRCGDGDRVVRRRSSRVDRAWLRPLCGSRAPRRRTAGTTQRSEPGGDASVPRRRRTGDRLEPRPDRQRHSSCARTAGPRPVPGPPVPAGDRRARAGCDRAHHPPDRRPTGRR